MTDLSAKKKKTKEKASTHGDDEEAVINDHVDEVASWIHDEQNCVTAACVGGTLGVSRTVASRVLQKVAMQPPAQREQDYYVTRCVVEKTTAEVPEVPKTVLRLVTSKYKPQDDESAGEIYALQARADEPSKGVLNAAHEKDMAMVRDGQWQPHNHHFAVAPAPQIAQLMTTLTTSAVSTSSSPVKTKKEPLVSLSRQKLQKQQVTTAASFFEKKKTKHNNGISKNKKSNSLVQHFSRKKDDDETPKEESNGKSNHKVSGGSKTNATSLRGSSKAVGNADDFVGDLDDSEDDDDDVDMEEAVSDEMEVEEPEEDEPEEDDDSEVEEVVPAKKSRGRKADDENRSGAMDSFLTASARSSDKPAESSTQRRRKLVEKSKVDDKGYLCTETAYEWVEETESAPAPAAPKPAAPKPAAPKPAAPPRKAKAVTTGKKKQGSITGFFKKTKK